MKTEEFVAIFEDSDGSEHLKAENIKPEHRFHDCPQINAFLLLFRLHPIGDHRLLSQAGHDQIWFSSDVDVVAENATEEDALNLLRCGVFYDEEHECLTMFV